MDTVCLSIQRSFEVFRPPGVLVGRPFAHSCWKVYCYSNVPFKAFKWILLISEILWIWTGHRFVTHEDLYVINDVTPFWHHFWIFLRPTHPTLLVNFSLPLESWVACWDGSAKTLVNKKGIFQCMLSSLGGICRYWWCLTQLHCVLVIIIFFTNYNVTCFCRRINSIFNSTWSWA